MNRLLWGMSYSLGIAKGKEGMLHAESLETENGGGEERVPCDLFWKTLHGCANVLPYTHRHCEAMRFCEYI